VQEDLDSPLLKRPPQQPHNPTVVFEIFRIVVDEPVPVIVPVKSLVLVQFEMLELQAHIILLADKYQLPRGGDVFVFQEIVHRQPKVVQAELWKVVLVDAERVEVVLLEIPASGQLLLAVFANEKASGKKNERNRDFRQHWNRDRFGEIGESNHELRGVAQI
jgi:hypothetical protein